MVAGVAGVVVMLVAVPLILPAVGFTTSGVAAGSAAAAWQSAIGNVAAGSWFAWFQSVGKKWQFSSELRAYHCLSLPPHSGGHGNDVDMLKIPVNDQNRAPNDRICSGIFLLLMAISADRIVLKTL